MQVPITNLAPTNAKLGMSRDNDVRNQEGAKNDFSSMVSDRNRPTRLSTTMVDKKWDSKKDPVPNEIISRNQKQKKLGQSEAVEDRENLETNESTVSEGKQGSKKTSRPKDIKNSAVLKLMASLENEFGISAERFSAALAQLPSEIKAMPIVKSAPFVIDELGIPEGQQVAATEAYVNLLSQSGLIENENELVNAKLANYENQNGIEIPSNLVKENNQPEVSDSKLITKMTKRQKFQHQYFISKFQVRIVFHYFSILIPNQEIL